MELHGTRMRSTQGDEVTLQRRRSRLPSRRGVLTTQSPQLPDDRGNLFAACRAKTPALALLPRTLHITDTRTRTVQPDIQETTPIS
mgnify:CR=1 FL=1